MMNPIFTKIIFSPFVINSYGLVFCIHIVISLFIDTIEVNNFIHLY
jgi:hypothetical protein